MSIFRPEDYGASPAPDARTGAPDCRPGIQAAIDACVAAGGGDVVLGPGHWRVSRSPAGTYNRFAAISCHGANVRIVGAGKLQTTLVLAGDAGAATFTAIQLDPGASNVLIEGFTIDTTGLFNTDAGEQTHAIAIGSGNYTATNGTDQMPVRDVVVRDVRFLHAGAAGERWGDAIRVGGNTEQTPAINVRLVGLDFVKVGRSGIAMQRNVRGLLIQGCYFDADNIGGTAIDGEATGGGWDTGLVVDGNQIVRTLPGGDNFAIALTSQTHFAVTNNVIRGRGISLVRCADGVIANNVVDTTDMDTVGVVAVDNLCRDVVFTGNTLHRRGKNGTCIQVQPRNGVFPVGVVIANNAITNDTDGAAVLLSGASDVVVTGNKITGNGSASSIGVYADAGLRAVENLAVTGNTFRGCGYAAVRLATKTPTATEPARSFTGCAVTGNVSRASGPGLRSDNPAHVPPGGIVSGLNNWSTPGWAPP